MSTITSDTYYWVYLSSDHLFQVYYKKRQVLQNVTILLQSAIGILQSGAIITAKCDRTNLQKSNTSTIQHNRTLQQSNIKPVSSGFKQGVVFIKTNKLYIAFNFKHEYAKDATEGGKREINNSGSDS